MADETDYDYFVKKAEELVRGGNYRDAAGIYSDLIEISPKVRAAYLGRGACHVSLREFDRAIDDFGMAIRLTPKDPRAHLARAWRSSAKGRRQRPCPTRRRPFASTRRSARPTDAGPRSSPEKGVPDRAAAAHSEALTAFYRRGVASILKHDYELGNRRPRAGDPAAPHRAERSCLVWEGATPYRLDYPNAAQGIHPGDRPQAGRQSELQRAGAWPIFTPERTTPRSPISIVRSASIPSFTRPT